MMRSIIILTCLCLAAQNLWAGTCAIKNTMMSVHYDEGSGSFSATDRASGKMFLTHGQLEGKASKSAVEDMKDKIFGQGRRILLTLSDGSTTSLELYNDLPFVLVRKTVRNSDDTEMDISKAVPATFTLNLEKPAQQLRTMGTGGLLPPDKNSGSYLFLTCADPATRNGVVAGWLTMDRGSGVLFPSVKSERVEFKAQIDYGHLCIGPGKSADLETLAIGYFADARIGQEKYADAVARQYDIKLRPKTGVYCTWYADQHGGAGDEKSTIQLAKFAAKELKEYGFGVVQIDDKWQDGPRIDGPARGFERCRPKGPYPHGIQPVAKAVDDAGLTLGLWWLPFGANHRDPAWKDRQDWFAHWADGSVMRTRAFGGTCLDLTHPKVKEYLAMLSKRLRSWGVEYYKMDGLWTGTATELVYGKADKHFNIYVDDQMSNVAPFYDRSKTQIEAYRDGLKLLRDNAGDEVFFSGCCMSQNMRSIAAVGLVDAMRIGPDFNHDGQGIRTGPIHGSRVYFMNGRLWWNDPDPTKVRVSKAKGSADPGATGDVSLAQARLTASWVAIADQFFLISDWLPALPANRMDILKRTMLGHGAVARPVDYFDNPLPNAWLVTDTRTGTRRDVIGFFNFQNKPLKVNYSCEKIGLDPSRTYHAFDYWANAPLSDLKGIVKDEVAGNSCRVMAVRAAEDHPVLISTSRHVSQGIVDVKQEKWSGTTLSGVSQVIGNDPYELRIAGLNDGGKTWVAKDVKLSTADQAAGVTATLKATGELLRLSIHCPITREIHWSVEF